jgi:hypothetical protein
VLLEGRRGGLYPAEERKGIPLAGVEAHRVLFQISENVRELKLLRW